MKIMRKKRKDSTEVWENRELGASEKFVRRATSVREKKLDESLGLQSISIRLQKSLINQLKSLANDDGIGYQPYIRQVLMRHIRNEKLKNNKQIHEAR